MRIFSISVSHWALFRCDSSYRRPQAMSLNLPLSEEDTARIVEDLDTPPDDDDVDPEDSGKPWQSSFLTSGGLRGCRAALVFYLIETFLPPEDYWMYYILIVHFFFFAILTTLMYGFSIIWTALVYFMHVPPCISYLVCIAFEKIFLLGGCLIRKRQIENLGNALPRNMDTPFHVYKLPSTNHSMDSVIWKLPSTYHFMDSVITKSEWILDPGALSSAAKSSFCRRKRNHKRLCSGRR